MKIKEKGMKHSMKKKKRFWALAWGCSCLLAAGAMALWAGAKPTGCKVRDITGFPAVISASSGKTEGGEAQKQVCLTFDDGPSPTTEKVLEILAEKQVPATFFVIAAPNNEEYLPTIRKEVQAGHQIGLHSASHEYKQIYASPTAFWADIKQLREKIEPYADLEDIHWIRFPGGSTNTVSHRYGGSEIMKTLKRQAQEKGYQYIDWNVCAGDAVGGHPSPETLFENVTREAKGKDRCVVLMHDTKVTKNTAKALPDIIDWFKENGYEFCRVDQMKKSEHKQSA